MSIRTPIHTSRLVRSCLALFAFAVAAGVAHGQASITGTWNGAILEARSNCVSAVNNGNFGTYAQIDIGVGAGAINISQVGITGLTCTYTGPYSESGSTRQASGNFTCTDGRRGTWLVTDFLVTENALSLKIAEQLTSSETCTINAVMGGSRLTPTQAPQPSIDYTGAWYLPSESGWGLSIVKGASTTLGVILYHYDPDRSPAWYILQNGAWQSPTVFAGTLYRFSGPAYSEVFNPAQVSNASVGTATLTFTSATQATLAYSINGVALTKSVTKLAF
jgi:hypothetical protein